jgi:hypothetical protein
LSLSDKRYTRTEKRDDGEENTYSMDSLFMRKIYDAILEKYKNHIFKDDDDQDTLCVDNPCNNTFTIDEIRAAYGYSDGLRSSEHYIDRFVTLELLHLMEEMNIENEMNCVIMGYFHGDVYSGTYSEEDKKTFLEGFLPGEFAIPYKGTVNKHYMRYVGQYKQPYVSTETRKRERSPEEGSSTEKRQKPMSTSVDRGVTKKKRKRVVPPKKGKQPRMNGAREGLAGEPQVRRRLEEHATTEKVRENHRLGYTVL